jgi:endoglucanase
MKAIYYMASGRLSFIKSFFVLMLLSRLGFAQTEQRLTFSGITPSVNTGQDYSPWLNDSVDSLVQAQWLNNFLYIDVTLKLQTPGKITKLSLYDYEGVFTSQPAYIYALKGTKKTLLKKFTGPQYMTWETTKFKVPVDADAIVIHKYSNNIPQKIFVYGYPDTVIPVTPPPVTPPVVVPDSVVKIPITASRWYQLNNVSNGLDALTDGVIDVDVNTGWGKLINNFDAYYPVADGEKITLSKVKFFSFQGGLDQPMTLSIINSQGRRIPVGTFSGFHYYTWLGPYPDRQTSGDAQFNLDSTITDIKYLVINSSGGYPTEMELYGTYKAPNSIPPMIPKATKLKQFFGINAFEWNFENGAIDPTKIDSTQLKAVKSFTQIRHYMDWEKLESDPGSYTFNPTRSGGWNYDAIYQYCKSQGIEVLADLKQLPGWMVDSYPDSLKDSENVPLKYGKDYSDPASYIEQAKVAFQYVARYGANASVDSTLLSVNGTPRWTADPVNVVKRGMNLIKYIECDNERDKWWKGRKAYQTSYEYAANLSAFYDGNKNTMGAGVGVKNADASIQVVMGGLASADPGYVRGMIDWCKQHRGFKADGSVNLCWDVINYHLYSNDSGTSQNGQSTRGTAPDVGNTGQTARSFVQMAHELAKDMPVWVTELGYDQNQGSPLKAIPIGSKTVAQVQADWILRSSLLYARNGVDRIFFYQMYDDNALNPIQFGSSGLINDDKTRRPSADYLYQTNKLLGEYTYKETLNTDPIVDHYDLMGKAAYVLVVPDEKGRTADYQLDLPGVDSAKVYTLTIGTDSMAMQYMKTVDGKLKITVTETPIFVIPVPGSAIAAQSFAALPPATDTKIAPVSITAPVQGNTLKLYPNPSAGYVSVAFNSADVNNSVSVSVLNEQTGKVYKSFTEAKGGQDYARLIDLSSVAIGVYVIQVKQGNSVMTKKLIKVN